MCHLQQTTYACGHSRKSLVTPCSLALCLAPVPQHRAPSFCLNGLTITQTTTSPSPCGRNISLDSQFSCLDLAILAPLSTRHDAAKSELSGYAARAGRVAACVDAGMRPECEWDRVDGGIMGELKTQQDTYWSETLPMRLAWMKNMLVRASDEVDATYAVGVNGMLGRHGVDVTQDLDLDIQVDALDLHIPANEFGAEHLAVQMFAQVYAKIRERVREEVQLLEDLALVTCLDGVGWGLPMGDMETVRLLMGRVESREVRPVHGAVQVVKLDEMKGPEVVSMVGVKYDVLDTAEVDGWC